MKFMEKQAGAGGDDRRGGADAGAVGPSIAQAEPSPPSLTPQASNSANLSSVPSPVQKIQYLNYSGNSRKFSDDVAAYFPEGFRFLQKEESSV